MSAGLAVRLWLLQRVSGALLAVAVAVHLGTVIAAARGGLSAAEIIARLHGHWGWAAFYALFVIAAAIHAPLGLRTVLAELTPLPARLHDGLAVAFGVLLLGAGLTAAMALFSARPV